MRVTCSYCPRIGQLGNTVRYEKIIENGKRISIPVCNRCIQKIPVRKRPR